MRFFAEYVMRGPWQASFAAGVCALIPFLSPFGGAIVALVWLRMGAEQGVKVLLLPLLAGAYLFATTASPDVIFGVLGAAFLAHLLRANQGWPLVLGVASVLASLLTLSFNWLDSNVQKEIFEFFLKQPELSARFVDTGLDTDTLFNLFSQLLNGLITSGQLMLLLASLMLARWWQALLYNPGGFQQEMHSLILPRWFGLGLGILLALIFGGNLSLLAILPLIAMPFLIAGLTLIHGVFALKKYHSFWLGLVYVALLFIQPYVSLGLVLFALADSWLNFRKRLALKA